MVATFRANSFLWHQIRYIMAVLFHVGRGLEKAEVWATLFSSPALVHTASRIRLWRNCCAWTSCLPSPCTPWPATCRWCVLGLRGGVHLLDGYLLPWQVLQQCDYDEGSFDWRGHDEAASAFALYNNMYALYEVGPLSSSSFA